MKFESKESSLFLYPESEYDCYLIGRMQSKVDCMVKSSHNTKDIEDNRVDHAIISNDVLVSYIINSVKKDKPKID